MEKRYSRKQTRSNEEVSRASCQGESMKLRAYQTEAVSAVQSAWRNGNLDTLLVAATGAGKTQMFLSILMSELSANPEARALVIAHRQELIDQPIERIQQMDSEWLNVPGSLRPRVGIMMGDRNDYDRQLTIATVQTLANKKRRDMLLGAGKITHLVIDECHHATAPTYMSLYAELKAANPELKHLGVTATPMRADGDGLSKVYKHVSSKITIATLVKAGYLVQPRWLGISTGISIDGVHSRAGDYVQSELAAKFDTPEGRAIILEAYQQYGSGRRAIAFTASVVGAHQLAAAFNGAGISAIAVDGTTPKDERKTIMAAFRRGEYTILANCQVATEGFDAPGTSCILMCRPTRSDSLYIQCMGRGLRPAMGVASEGEDCLILDFLPKGTRDIVMAGDVLGLPKEVTRAVKNEDKEPGEVQAGFTFDGDTFNSSGTPMEIIARELLYLEHSPFTWFRRDGLLTLGLGKSSDGVDRILAISGDQLIGLWRRDGQYDYQCKAIACDDPYSKAQELAERNANILNKKDMAWHYQTATEGQTKYLKRLAGGLIKPAELSVMNKRLAADLITHFQVYRAIERYSEVEV
jgi:superfamily II DNA or RNA helicase